jgi:hypothetical protein
LGLFSYQKLRFHSGNFLLSWGRGHNVSISLWIQKSTHSFCDSLTHSILLLPLYRINFNLWGGALSGFGRLLLLSWTKSCQTVTNPDQVFLNFDSFGDERQLRQKCAASSFVNDDCALSQRHTNQPTNQPHYKVFWGVSGRESERAPAQCIRDWRSAYIMNKCRARAREEGRKEKREIAHIAHREREASVILLPLLLLTSRLQSFFGGKLTWKHSSARVNQTFESLLCI